MTAISVNAPHHASYAPNDERPSELEWLEFEVRADDAKTNKTCP
jgi:hypothetical protein